MSKRESKQAIVASGGSHYIGEIWKGSTPTEIRDATPIFGGHVSTQDGRVALQVMTPPYGCAEGVIKTLHLGSVDNWVFVEELSTYDQQTVKDFLERKAVADDARRASEAGLVLPRDMSPEDMSKVVRGARG